VTNLRIIASLVAAATLAACSTSSPQAPEVERQAAQPRPALTSVVIEGVALRTLADEVSAREIARRAESSAARGYEGDNKGNACFEDPVFRGVVGGELNTAATRREEFWQYAVCGEAYEVPVIVTKQQGSGAVDFTVGSGREAR
jgi:hypothetical protein